LLQPWQKEHQKSELFGVPFAKAAARFCQVITLNQVILSFQ